MITSLYKPFERFTFNDYTCFLSGEKVDKGSGLGVFPEWILERYNLSEQPIKLLDERIVTYRDIVVPCADVVKVAADELEKQIQYAFLQGYEKVKKLDQLKLFQWIGKLVYGMIHFEIVAGIRQQRAAGEDLNFSQSLIHKFSNLQVMLQSLFRPVEFEGVMPWSILVFPVKNEEDAFSYRDEINTLTFSLKMNDFGIIATLQDNGANQEYNADLLEKVEDRLLHPIQFEELCGRIFYSAYLFNRLPDYTILPTPDAVYIESMPFYTMTGKPLFDAWQNKTYGQVLENFWKPWGYTLFEIIKDPEKPVSFLFDEDGHFKTEVEVNKEV